MKKQLTAALTAFLLCANTLPLGVWAATNTSGEYEGLHWSLADGVLTIGGEGRIVYDTGFPDGDSAKYPDWGQYADEITEIIIEQGVTGADADCFREYSALESVILPEGFASLSARLFQDCPKLHEIEGLEHVTQFHQHCLNGTAMTAENPFVIVGGRLQYCDYTEVTDIVVPDGVTSIGANAFGNLMEESSESILTDPFDKRTVEDLYFTITLPDSVEIIDDYAFANLTTLTSVNIPEAVTTIGAYAFLDCVRLDALTLGQNVQSVGDYAFFNCKELDTLTVLSGDTRFGTMAYGTLCDMVGCLMEANPDDFTAEYMAEYLEFDPYFYDAVAYYNVDWFGTGDYLWFDQYLMMETISHHLYTTPDAFVRGIANSSAKSLAYDTGVGFLELEQLGDCNGDTAVNSSDAAILLYAAAQEGVTGESGCSALQECAMDVDGSGTMNAVDAAWMLKYAAYKGSGGTMGLYRYVNSL